MNAADVKALRTALACTTRELGEAIGVDQATVLAWEAGRGFPTRRHCERMAALREAGPSAVPRRRRARADSPMKSLADPELWTLVRKLAAHRDLREAAARLAEDYPDPADDSSSST